MSTILVNNIKSYTGTTVTISGSNISVTGNTTLGDGAGTDNITINGNITASGDISASGTVFADRFQSATGGAAIDFNDAVSISTSITASTALIDGVGRIGIVRASFLNGNTGYQSAVAIGSASIDKVSSSIIPVADDTFDLGSSTNQWKDLYIDGTANIDSAKIDSVSGSLIPDADDTFDLGSSAKQWKDLYIDGTANIDSLLGVVTASIAHLELSGNVSGNLTPNQDDLYDLGGSGLEWRDLFVNGTANIDTLSVPGVSTLGIANVGFIQGVDGAPTSVRIGSASIETVSSSLTPDLDDTYDLGSSTKQWRNLFIDGTATIDAISGVDSLLATQGTGSFGLLNATRFSSSLVPGEDNIYSIGTSALRWSDLFLAEGAVINWDNGDATITQTGNTLTVAGADVTIAGNITASGNISASGNLSAEGSLTATSLTLDKGIQSAAATDFPHYTINGKRGEIRSQLQAGVAADTGWTLSFVNTSIAANSLIVANIIGGNGGIVSGSVVSANVIAENSASLNFFNTGIAIPDDAPFTASFAIF